VDIQIQRTAEALDQGHDASICRFVCQSCLFDQMGRQPGICASTV